MLNFIDKSFSVRKSSQYRLSIQVDLDGFSFSVYDPAQKKHVALRRVAEYLGSEYDLVVEKIRSVYNEVEWLNHPFSSCSCIYSSQKNTLIPTLYFSQERLRPFLSFVCPLDELDEIHFKTLDRVNAVAVFAVPNPIAAELYMKHKRITFYNQSVPLILNLLKKKDEEHLSLNVNGSIADLAIMRNGGLVYHNSFDVKSPPDLLYYVLFTLKQLGLEPAQLPTSLSGSFDAATKQLLTGYFPKAKMEKGISLPIANENIATYYQLLTVHECE